MEGEDEGATARFLLEELPPDCTEEDLTTYFGSLGLIEEVTLRTLEKNNRVVGSVKFTNPTYDLRNQMLKQPHEIRGKQVIVQTWKMKKMSKPSAYAKGAKGKAFGLKGMPSWGNDWGSWQSPTNGKNGKGCGAAAWWNEGWAPAGYGPVRGKPKGASCGKGFRQASDNMWPESSGDFGMDAWGPWPWAGPGPYDQMYDGVPPYGKKGGGAGGKDGGKSRQQSSDDITARFLLIDLPPSITEDDIRDYFRKMGKLEEVTLKQLEPWRCMGSVKFANPEPGLKGIMLQRQHEIKGIPLLVQTWKMQKMSRPGATLSAGWGKGCGKREAGFGK